MRYLLDTHALLWWLDGDPKLSAKARSIITSRQLDVFVSAATVWEITNKARIGKLPHALPVARNLPGVLSDQGFPLLSVTVEHSFEAGWLPGNHRDPFDRILAAQSIVEGFPLVTIDTKLADLGAVVVW